MRVFLEFGLGKFYRWPEINGLYIIVSSTRPCLFFRVHDSVDKKRFFRVHDSVDKKRAIANMKHHGWTVNACVKIKFRKGVSEAILNDKAKDSWQY